MVNQRPICDYEGSSYQKDFWDSGTRTYEDLCEANALKRLLPGQGRLLLELGAGAGRNTPRYAGYERIVLLDYSRTQLQEARRRLGDSHRYLYVAANIYALPFVNGLFDSATMIRTLHHMINPAIALREVRRTLEPKAKFVLEYANKRHSKAILRYLLGRQSWNPFSMEPVEYIRLNYDFHPRAVQGWLSESGFRILNRITVSHFRIGWLKRTFPPGLLASLDALFGLTGNLWQLTPSVFILAQADDSGEKQVAGFFQCPACGCADLPEEAIGEGKFLVCQRCLSKYPILDGIYDFKESVLS